MWFSLNLDWNHVRSKSSGWQSRTFQPHARVFGCNPTANQPVRKFSEGTSYEGNGTKIKNWETTLPGIYFRSCFRTKNHNSLPSLTLKSKRKKKCQKCCQLFLAAMKSLLLQRAWFSVGCERGDETQKERERKREEERKNRRSAVSPQNNTQGERITCLLYTSKTYTYTM